MTAQQKLQLAAFAIASILCAAVLLTYWVAAAWR